MERLASEIAKMPGMWRGVWTSLHQKYTVNISSYDDMSVGAPSQINTGHAVKRFWSMSTGRAEKHGWNWWGDTDIYVDEVVGPKTFEEVFSVIKLNIWLIKKEI